MTRCCLVVTTHDRADALARALASVARQSRLPDEVVIAEDGATVATAAVVRRFAAEARWPVRHLTQPHDGFRAGRIRNAAIASTDCEYVVLLDGDMVAHPRFLEDHVAQARKGHYSQGTRILLDQRATERLLAGGDVVPGPLAPGLGPARRAYAIRAPRLTGVLRRIANGLVSIKSCNQGFWRRDLVAANGFDEDLRGWGSEDKELCARLRNAGIGRQTLLFSAIAFHLAHPPASRDAAQANRARWRATVASGRTRCEVGIDGHSGA